MYVQHGRGPAAVLLRWSAQHGVATIPKSAQLARVTGAPALTHTARAARQRTMRYTYLRTPSLGYTAWLRCHMTIMCRSVFVENCVCSEGICSSMMRWLYGGGLAANSPGAILGDDWCASHSSVPLPMLMMSAMLVSNRLAANAKKNNYQPV